MDAAHLETACDFAGAAHAHLRAGALEAAAVAAARANDTIVEEAVVAAFEDQPARCAAAAGRLVAAGHPGLAGTLLAAHGDPGRAAPHFETARRWVEAARAHATAGAPREAARCFERRLRDVPHDVASRVELARLLADHRRDAAALRHLQKVPASGDPTTESLRQAVLERLGIGTGAPPAPAAASREHRLFGRYHVEATVAVTSTAEVLRCRDAITGATVAVKVLGVSRLLEVGRDALGRFEREARILGTLRSPAVVSLLAYESAGPALVLDWMSGGSLAARLAADSVAPAVVAEAARAVLGALTEAHRRGILHRDVKPANVLYDGAGRPRLSDFGVAHVSDRATTVTAGLFGTLAYLAPELHSGGTATVRSDLYAVGALLHHGLTGAPPPPAGGLLPFLSDDLDERHRDVLAKLLAPAEERPDDATEAMALLDGVPWPERRPPRRAPEREGATAIASRRLAGTGEERRDAVVERDVLVLTLTPALRDRARAYARAAHPALATVYRLDATSGQLWVEPGAPPGSLDASDERDLAAARAALGAQGVTLPTGPSTPVGRRGDQAFLTFVAPDGVEAFPGGDGAE